MGRDRQPDRRPDRRHPAADQPDGIRAAEGAALRAESRERRARAKKEPRAGSISLSALGSKLLLRSCLCLFAAGGHRRAAAIFTLQVNDRQTLGSPDDSRGQHPAPRTNHPDCCIGSSCHTIAPNPFRRRLASNGSLNARDIGRTPSLTPKCREMSRFSTPKLSIFPIDACDACKNAPPEVTTRTTPTFMDTTLAEPTFPSPVNSAVTCALRHAYRHTCCSHVKLST